MDEDEITSFQFDDTLFVGNHLNAGLAEEKPFRARLSMHRNCVMEILRCCDCADLARSEETLAALGTVFANLTSWSADTWIFYSRDRNLYSLRRAFLPRHITYHFTLDAIDTLAARGIILNRISPPSSYESMRSSFKSSPTLSRLLEERLATLVVTSRPLDPIILRNENKAPVSYEEADFTNFARLEVTEFTERLSCLTLSVQHPEARPIGANHVRIGNALINLSDLYLYRIFTISFDQHGRFYGGVWQNFPRRVRQQGLLLNGEQCIELDYRACHLRILCSLSGQTLPFDDPSYDPFAVTGFHRRQVKNAFNILLNTPSPRYAAMALARQIGKDDGRVCVTGDDRRLAKALLDHVQRRFQFLNRYWCRLYGLKLLNIDADLCAANMRELNKRGIPNLSVHDSFLVPDRHRDKLHEVMESSFEAVLRQHRKLTNV